MTVTMSINAATLSLILMVSSAAIAMEKLPNETRVEVRKLMAPHLEGDEVLCGVVRVPDYTAGGSDLEQYWIRLCRDQEQGGGRQFRVSVRDGEWSILRESGWVESAKAQPANQVRISVSISIDLARKIVRTIEPSVGDDEWLSLIRGHRELVEIPEDERLEPTEPEPGQIAKSTSHKSEVVENVYEVTTIRKDDPSGRVFVVYADSSQVTIQRVGSWWF